MSLKLLGDGNRHVDEKRHNPQVDKPAGPVLGFDGRDNANHEGYRGPAEHV